MQLCRMWSSLLGLGSAGLLPDHRQIRQTKGSGSKTQASSVPLVITCQLQVWTHSDTLPHQIHMSSIHVLIKEYCFTCTIQHSRPRACAAAWRPAARPTRPPGPPAPARPAAPLHPPPSAPAHQGLVPSMQAAAPHPHYSQATMIHPALTRHGRCPGAASAWAACGPWFRMQWPVWVVPRALWLCCQKPWLWLYWSLSRCWVVEGVVVVVMIQAPRQGWPAPWLMMPQGQLVHPASGLGAPGPGACREQHYRIVWKLLG